MLSTAETGYCALHARRRTRVDLIEWPERPGQLRCLPRKECRPRVESEAVMCRVHNKKRNVHQMREVAPGVYECKPEHVCRLVAASVMSGINEFQNVGARPYVPPTAPSSTSFAPAWTPVAISLPTVAMPQAAGNATQAVDVLPHEVWCSKHGKKILRALCDFVDEACYVCRDSAICRATPLESAEHLRARRCTELLCSKHNSLRLVSFLVLKDDGYECAVNHQCRGVSAPSIGGVSQQAIAFADNAGMGQSTAGVLSDMRQTVAPSSFFS